MTQDKIKAEQKKHSLVFQIFFIIGIIAVVAIGGRYALRYVVGHILYESTDDAFVEGHIISVSPKVSGTISKVLVQDNQDVKKGDLLLIIDPCDYEAKVRTYKAALTVAKTEAEKAKANIEVSKAQADFTQADLQRYEGLSGTSSISQQNMDSAKTAVASTKAALEVSVKSAASADARVAQTQTELEQAELALSYTKIYAPQDGRIAQKHAEEGSFVATGQPLMAIISYEVWVVANFKETQLDDIHPGQKVTISIDAYSGEKLKGRVQSIQSGTGARFSLLPPENATGNYVKVIQRVPVKIIFDEPVENLKHLALGMSVEPKIYIAAKASEQPHWLRILERLGGVRLGSDGEDNQ